MIFLCIFLTLGVKHKTKVISNNLDPVWDEVSYYGCCLY